MGPGRRLTPGSLAPGAVRRWAIDYVRRRREELGGSDAVDPASLVASAATTVVAALGGDRGCLRPDRPGTLHAVPATEPEPPGGWANPWLIGWIHEQAVSGDERRRRGAWYTPEPLVRGLVGLAWEATRSQNLDPDFVVDPTCGSGAFLLATADRLVGDGLPPGDALERIAGCDIDPLAVACSRWSLTAWALQHGIDPDPTSIDVIRGDALQPGPARWPERRLVLGNPPFASPLRSGRMPPEAEDYRRDHADHLGRYADLAAIHLHRAVVGSAPGSVVVLVQPQSVVAGRDTADLRSFLGQRAPLAGLWAAREAVFDAGVRACAPVLVVGGEPPATVLLAAGPSVRAVDPVPATSWAGCAARALGGPSVPEPVTRPVSTLAELATATAGFRDEYYGLAKACVEWHGPDGDEPNRLLTVGSVDPLATRWGRDRLRFAGESWLRPWIDVAALDGKTSRWWERQRRPKVVLATQSKLLEPVIDTDGRLVPCTPLVAVHADHDDLPMIAAVLLAPPVVAAAWQRWFGTALSVDALKLAASQVLELPLPADRRRWRQAAELLAEAPGTRDADRRPEEGWALAVEVAAMMNTAFRSSGEVMAWWLDRVPNRLRS